MGHGLSRPSGHGTFRYGTPAIFSHVASATSAVFCGPPMHLSLSRPKGGVGGTGHLVVAPSAEKDVVAVRTTAGMVADEEVVAFAAEQLVVAGTAVDSVVAVVTTDHVVAVVPVQMVVAGAAGDPDRFHLGRRRCRCRPRP